MSNRLLVNPGTPQAWAITLRPGVNRIGSDPGNDFTINHASISPQHCEITVTEQAVRVKDLGSTQGTFVERVPVSEARLYSGQKVQLGSVSMTFEIIGLPPLPDAVNLPADGAQIMVANPSPVAPPAPPLPAATSGDTVRITNPATTPVSPAPVTEFVSTAANEPGHQQLLIRGGLGAVIGGISGILAWVFLVKLTGINYNGAAWGVGALTGTGGRLLARQGSVLLGLVCGLIALLAIVTGEFYGIRTLVAKEADTEYVNRMAFAKSVTTAKTDDEFRALLAKEQEKAAEQIGPEEIRTFRETELPVLKDFANGQPSREEFTKDRAEAFIAKFSFSEHFFKTDPKAGIFMIIFVGLGVITAWKIGKGDKVSD